MVTVAAGDGSSLIFSDRSIHACIFGGNIRNEESLFIKPSAFKREASLFLVPGNFWRRITSCYAN